MIKKPKKQPKRKAQPDFSQTALSAVESAIGGKLVQKPNQATPKRSR
jgi:hypothetical protein